MKRRTSAVALCPNGCGTKLVKRKFVDVFDENMKLQLRDVEESLYCTTCHIRWIPESHSSIADLPASKIEFESVTVKVPKLVMDYLRKTEDNPVEALEFTIVDHVRAEIEGMRSDEWADVFNLKTIFADVLGDKRYS